jgi:hypothetical protein
MPVACARTIAPVGFVLLVRACAVGMLVQPLQQSMPIATAVQQINLEMDEVIKYRIDEFAAGVEHR